MFFTFIPHGLHNLKHINYILCVEAIDYKDAGGRLKSFLDDQWLGKYCFSAFHNPLTIKGTVFPASEELIHLTDFCGGPCKVELMPLIGQNLSYKLINLDGTINTNKRI